MLWHVADLKVLGEFRRRVYLPLMRPQHRGYVARNHEGASMYAGEGNRSQRGLKPRLTNPPTASMAVLGMLGLVALGVVGFSFALAQRSPAGKAPDKGSGGSGSSGGGSGSGGSGSSGTRTVGKGWTGWPHKDFFKSMIDFRYALMDLGFPTGNANNQDWNPALDATTRESVRRFQKDFNVLIDASLVSELREDINIPRLIEDGWIGENTTKALYYAINFMNQPGNKSLDWDQVVDNAGQAAYG